MTFDDISNTDLVTFVALARALTMADRVLSPDEFDHLQALADDIGRKRFDAAMRAAARTILGAEQALAAASRVRDPLVRTFLYDRLVELGETDLLDDAEVLLLERLAVQWHQLAPA